MFHTSTSRTVLWCQHLKKSKLRIFLWCWHQKKFNSRVFPWCQNLPASPSLIHNHPVRVQSLQLEYPVALPLSSPLHGTILTYLLHCMVPCSGEHNWRATGYFSWRLWTQTGWTWMSDGDAGRFWHHGNTLELNFFWCRCHRNILNLDFFWCWHHRNVLEVLIWNVLELQAHAVVEHLSNLLCIVHYSAREPEMYCLMKVFGPKRWRRKRIAEPYEDCWTNRSCEKVLQSNILIWSMHMNNSYHSCKLLSWCNEPFSFYTWSLTAIHCYWKIYIYKSAYDEGENTFGMKHKAQAGILFKVKSAQIVKLILLVSVQLENLCVKPF